MTIKKLKKNINIILNILQLSSLSLPFIYAIIALTNTDTGIIRNIVAVLLLIITGFAFWYVITVHDASSKEKTSNYYEVSVEILLENKFDKICEKLFLNFVSLITISLFRIPDDIFNINAFNIFPYRKEDFYANHLFFKYKISELLNNNNEGIIQSVKKIGKFNFKYIFMKLSKSKKSSRKMGKSLVNLSKNKILV